MARLTDYRVLTFDCYGTLIDWEGGIWDALQPLIMRGGADVTRDAALLAFAKFETAHERDHPDLRYPDLLARVHRSIAESLGIETSDALDDAFGASVPLWPRVRGYRGCPSHPQAALQARDPVERAPRRLRRLQSQARGGVRRDLHCGRYRVLQAGGCELRVHAHAPEVRSRAGQVDILHTAQSLHHDHTPARRFGLANAWIDRQRLSQGGSWGATEEVDAMPETDFVFFSMAEIAEAVAAEAE